MEPYADNPIMFFINNYIVLCMTFFCSFLVFIKTNGLTPSRKAKILYSFLILLLPAIFQLLGGYENTFVKLIFISTICISLVLLDTKNIYTGIPTSIISISISYGLEYISVILSSIVLYVCGYIKVNFLTTVITSILQAILCIGLSKLRIIKKCFFYFSNEKNFGIGLLVSSYILIFSLLLTHYGSEVSKDKAVYLFGIPLILVGLVLWIRSIIEGYYKRKIANRADAFTQQEITEKDEKIERLEAEVATLAKQLHRDNHLLSSLDRSVQTLGETESAAEREQLVSEIRTLYRERNDLIAKEQQESRLLPSTGIALIDGALSEMYVKATAHGIGFDLIVGEPIHYLVNNIISQTDLQTLLCDHIKDAIIAVSAADIANGSILVTIKKNEGIFAISIHDNGVDFAPDTLAKLGKERVTTHAEDGGSGIGFMTTFETLEKTKGSLIITEYESRSPFSKAIAFNFDGLHRFLICSYRKEELQGAINRDDVTYI